MGQHLGRLHALAGGGGGQLGATCQQVLSGLETEYSAVISGCTMTVSLPIGTVTRVFLLCPRSRFQEYSRECITHMSLGSPRRCYWSSCPGTVSCAMRNFSNPIIGGHGISILPHIGCLRNRLPRAQQEGTKGLQPEDVL